MYHPLPNLLRRSTLVVLATLISLNLFSTSYAQEKVNEKQATASKRAAAATKALNDIAALPAAESIPAELLARAKVVAVFPNITKVNLVFQKAMKGSGLATRRTAEGWGTPVFYQFSMIDSGWTTAEAKSPTIIMLFLNEATVNEFKENYVEIGGTVAGPIGETLTETDKKRMDGVRLVAYGFRDGKLIGVKIEQSDSTQSGMYVDNAMNKPTYAAKGADVFFSTAEAKGVPEIEELRTALTKFVRKSDK